MESKRVFFVAQVCLLLVSLRVYIWPIYNDQTAEGMSPQMVVVKRKGSVPQNGLKLG